MSVDEDRKKNRYAFDRHTPEYREQFETITQEMQQKCPVAWSDTHGGHWVAAGAQQVFEIARSAELLSNEHDVNGSLGHGYKGITVPAPNPSPPVCGGFLEMDPPEQRHYRQALNPYLSPSAVNRWIPIIDEVVRASLDERIETGRIDFVDDLANVVPAVITLGMLGISVHKWHMYSEPTHASVYTPPNTPEMQKVREQQSAMFGDVAAEMGAIRENPRPGLINALVTAEINGNRPDDLELLGVIALLIGGGFDTTTALTAHALEWLSEHPGERERLSRERDTLLNPATEEFLRFFTPAPGDARTITEDCEIAGTRFAEGERVWLSWAMANRDPAIFDNPNEIVMDRKGNRHLGFGLGIHRCIGSNLARTVFKRMVVQVMDRMPDYRCEPEGTVHYQTIGVIQGMQKLPATFTPGSRQGPGLEETLDNLQRTIEEERLAEPVTTARSAAKNAR
ncbi:cytochrome P450 [Actinomadura rugatobispora]|uniref:Cytochrome P450 n=1 Tax=Actinomadura rugatobispora TaxID=1994 RepID=A0ABW0ZSK8_9ACTN|nr:cytochrome P450 [Actinomadura rugatobispora]